MIEILRKLTDQLRDTKPSCTHSPRIDAEILLAHTLQVKRNQLLSLNRTLTPAEQALLNDLISKRQKGYPIDYITQKTEFYGLSFYIRESVFIPRPETEKLIKTALTDLKPGEKVLDMGAGSGCIGLTVALKRPDVKVLAWEKSPQALKVLKQNFKYHNQPSNYSFELFDIGSSHIKDSDYGAYHTVLSNPPYIGYTDQNIDFFVKKYEPKDALFSGTTGFECIQMWSHLAYQILINQGMAYFEIGFQQATGSIDIFRKNGFVDIKIIKDDLGEDRIIIGKKLH